MASADLREELLCSICLNIYTDPVTLRCGHNFCRVCIDQHLNTQDGSGVYSCPECRAKFQKRPALQKNITLCNVVENLLSTQCKKCSIHKKILEYYCTEDAACICVSCCLIGEHRGHQMESLDEASEKKKKKLRNDLQKLITKKNKTEERVKSLENHRRKAQDKTAGEVERLTALFIDIRRYLDDLEKRILSEISRQKKKQSLSLSALIHQLEIKKDELSRKMRNIEELCNMTDPLTVLQEPDTGDLCDPEEEVGDEDTGGHDGGDEDTGGHDGGDDNTGGHDGGDEDTGGHDGGDEDTGGHDGGDEDTGGHDGGDEDTGGHDGGDEDTGGHDGGDEDTGGHDGDDRGAELISHISHVLSDIIRGVNVTFYVQDPADILLDVNTANYYILISDDLKTAIWTNIKQNGPETAERFQDYSQVISSRRFTSGRHYWDVEISRTQMWSVGMCYPSIDRRGDQSVIGNNNKSWCLYGWPDCNNQYSVIHDNKEIQLPYRISSDSVRICLDYEAGQLSFYALCDPIIHLHTFTATFTEPLHAVLCVYHGYIKILKLRNN